MRNDIEDKYTGEEDDTSQVRSIINQLNQDKPSVEKSREVVVRPDGTKVIRVTKKRKQLVSNEEKNKKSRKKLLISLLACLLLVGLATAFYMYKMSVMCSASYLEEKKVALCSAWGANSVELDNLRIEGNTLKIDKLVARFPEDAMLETIEMHGLDAPLDMSSFFSGEFRADNLSVKSADVRLRRHCDVLRMPRWQGAEPLWNIRAVSCAKLSFSIGTPTEAPILLRNAEAQLYPAAGQSSSQVLTVKGGTLSIAGIGSSVADHSRYDFRLLNGKMFITGSAIEDIRFCCQDPKSAIGERESTRDAYSAAQAKELASSDFVLMSDKIEDGQSLYGPFSVEIDRLSFALVTHGLFDKILGAEVSTPLNDRGATVTMTIAPNGALTTFVGDLFLSNIQFRDADLAAKSVFISHMINANQSRKYAKLIFSQARVKLSQEEGNYVLAIQEGAMVESGAMDLSVFGHISVGLTSQNGQWNDLPLAGELCYSLPKKMLNSEYKNGIIDPIFVNDPTNDLRCLFKTKLSGVSIMPEDDSRAQVIATEAVRSTLEKAQGIYDVDTVPEVLRSDDSPTEDSSTEQSGADDIFKPRGERKISDKELFGIEDEDDIFKSSAPTVPADSSIKF